VHDAMVVLVRGPSDQPGLLGTVDQLDGRVVPQQEVFGKVADRRLAIVPSDRQQELVLRGGQADLLGLALAPPEEAAQAVTEPQQLGVLRIVEVHENIVSRYICPMPTSEDPKQLVRLAALAAVIGLLAGGAAWALVHLIALVTNLALFHRVGWELPDFSELDISPLVVLTAVAGAAVVSLLARWSPVIRGHGLPETMEAILTRQSRIAPRTAIAKPLSAAIAIGTGGPFGAEGPIIVTGGALGSLIGQAVRVSPNQRKILLASGAAAGMAATFGSPLASVVLAIELLLFEFSARAFIPLVVAASVAGGVHAQLFGSGPLFDVPNHDFSGLGQLPLFVAVGLLSGLLATLIAKGLFLVEGLYRRLPMGEAWHPVLGALAFSSLGLLVPRALGVGYDVIDDALAGRLALGTLAALAVGKLVIWWIALASGTSGGTLAPILIVSSASGALLGQLLADAFPGLGLSPSSVALVAMSATFGAAARAPFAAIVFLFELTRDYDAILPLMGATVLADLVARFLLRDSIMTEKLTRRGLLVPNAFHVDAMRTTTVKTIMSPDVVTIPADLPLARLVESFEVAEHSAYPVVDDTGRLVGIVTQRDVVNASGTVTARQVAEAEVVVASPDEPVALALQRMLEEGVDHLPVIDDGRLVGICTRTDVLHTRRRDLEHDRTQRGWLR
jgi:CIC family chloride channel protein